MHVTLINGVLLLNWVTSCIILTFIIANFVGDILLYLQRKELRKEFEKEQRRYLAQQRRHLNIVPFKKPAA